MHIGITGHQRLAADAWVWVEAELDRLLAGLAAPLVGVSSLAAGADSLFAERVLACGGTLEVVLPFEGYARELADEAERARFGALLGRAAAVRTLADALGDKQDAYFEAGRQVVQASALLVAVWDGAPARGRGGTGDAVGYARGLGRRVVHVDPTRRVTTWLE